MTPEERNLVAELFDRLATLEDAPRDPEAERLIKDGLRQAPNAVYALVQTALVQDEALKRADAHIRELEAELGPAEQPPRQGGFLDNMRGALFGRNDAPRPGSVPSVPPVRQGDTPWGPPPPPGYAAGSAPGYGGGAPPMGAEPMRPGGSFLGTMAASAAGVIGGSLMLDSIRSMMGHRQGAFGGMDQASAGTHAASSPWTNSGGGNLAHDAGIDDIGRNPTQSKSEDHSTGQGQGLLDSNADGGGDGAKQDDFDSANQDDFDSDTDDGDMDDGGGDDNE